MKKIPVTRAIPAGDIEDLAAFVVWQVEGMVDRMYGFSETDLPEALDEGLVLAWDLYQQWDPERCPKFSAFMLSLFHRRMLTWWRTQLRQSTRGSWSWRRKEYTPRTLAPLTESHPNLIVHGPD